MCMENSHKNTHKDIQLYFCFYIFVADNWFVLQILDFLGAVKHKLDTNFLLVDSR